MRLMMQDRVNNRLTVWLSLTDVQARTNEAGRDEREAVSVAAARAVSLELEKMSFEALRSWEKRNARFLYSALH
jgi:two-component sensor histidine kinase